MDGWLLDPGPILATDLWYSLGWNASLLWASFSHWIGGTGVGRYLTLSSSGLHRGRGLPNVNSNLASCPQLLPSFWKSGCLCASRFLHLSGPQRSHVQAGNLPLSLKVPDENTGGPGGGELRPREGTLALQVQVLVPNLEDSQSSVVEGGTTDHKPPCLADWGGSLRFFLEPKPELSSWLRSTLCHAEQLKAKQHFISNIW